MRSHPINLQYNFILGKNDAFEFMQWALREGSDISVVNSNGYSILISMLRSRYNCLENQHDKRDKMAAKLVRLFVKNKIQLVKDRNKDSLLHIAAEKRFVSTIDTLIQYGVDEYGRNERGFTPLHSCLLFSAGK